VAPAAFGDAVGEGAGDAEPAAAEDDAAEGLEDPDGVRCVDDGEGPTRSAVSCSGGGLLSASVPIAKPTARQRSMISSDAKNAKSFVRHESWSPLRTPTSTRILSSVCKVTMATAAGCSSLELRAKTHSASRAARLQAETSTERALSDTFGAAISMTIRSAGTRHSPTRSQRRVRAAIACRAAPVRIPDRVDPRRRAGPARRRAEAQTAVTNSARLGRRQ